VDLNSWLSPVENRGGRLYKREDLAALPVGVNGSKLRACEHLIGRAARAGAKRVISAASVLSPQSAMAAVLARRHGLGCTVVVGGTKPTTAIRHPSIRMAVDHGAGLEFAAVDYNPALQSYARRLAATDPAAYWLQYGITTPPAATREELLDFHAVAARQTENLPDGVGTLVVPFGSGNTAAGVLMGLAQRSSADRPRKTVLVGIGPDRRAWLADRFAAMGLELPAYEHLDLHGSGYASYGDKMPGTADGIRLHPTYEGKVVRYLNEKRPDWWTRRDGTTCLWIVGGPIS
jgi:hypothetical protein